MEQGLPVIMNNRGALSARIKKKRINENTATGGMNMPTGTVKWFNNRKGYGFVVPDQGDEDVFIHFSSIQMDGFKTLKEGQKIAFEISEGPKGLHATNIQPDIS
jgi:CspA family cold shock protein